MRRTSSASSVLRRDSSSPTRAPCRVGMLALIMHRRGPRPYTRMQGRLIWLNGDSPFSSRFSASRSSFRSSASAAVSRRSAASRACRRTRRSSCGSAAISTEMAPDDVVGYLRGVRTPTVRVVVDSLRKAKVDSRIRAVLHQADRVRVAVLGQGAGGPRRDARFQEVRQAALRLSRVRRRSRVLPGDGGRQGVPDAVDVARPGWRRHLRSCSCAARSTRSAPIRTCTTSATTRPPSTRSPRRAIPPRTGRWTSRSIAICSSRSSAASPRAGRRTKPRSAGSSIEGPFLPEEALRAGLVDDVQYEDQVSDEAARARATRGRSTATTTRASARRRSGSTAVRGLPSFTRPGTIASGKSGYDPVNGAVVGSDTLIEYIRRARRDSFGARHRPAD